MAGEISVVIPARNAANTLARPFAGLADDRRLIGQIILVDDASSDATSDVARALAAVHGLPLTVVNGGDARPVGPGAARNIGFGQTTGEFVYFVDADDEPIPGGLDALLAAARSTGRGLIVGGSVRRRPDGSDDVRLPAGYGADRRANAAAFLRNRHGPIIVGSALVRRDAVASIRFPARLPMDEDTCYWAAVLASVDVAAVVRPVIHYHFDPERMAARHGADPRAAFVAIAAAYGRLAQCGVARDAVQWRKAWLALRLARTALADGRRDLARGLLRPALAHPEFRRSWRVTRSRLRIALRLATRSAARRLATSG